MQVCLLILFSLLSGVGSFAAFKKASPFNRGARQALPEWNEANIDALLAPIENPTIPSVLIYGNTSIPPGFSMDVLSLVDLDQAVELIVNCHYRRIGERYPSFSSAITKRLFNSLDSVIVSSMKDRVCETILFRCGVRMQTLSLASTDESIIFVYKSQLAKEIVSSVELYPLQTPYVCNLSVSPKYRRQGIAVFMCKFVESFIQSVWGKEDIVLHVEKENIAAQKLYESLGYSKRKLSSYRHNAVSGLDKFLYGSSDVYEYYKSIVPGAG